MKAAQVLTTSVTHHFKDDLLLSKKPVWMVCLACRVLGCKGCKGRSYHVQIQCESLRRQLDGWHVHVLTGNPKAAQMLTFSLSRM